MTIITTRAIKRKRTALDCLGCRLPAFCPLKAEENKTQQQDEFLFIVQCPTDRPTDRPTKVREEEQSKKEGRRRRGSIIGRRKREESKELTTKTPLMSLLSFFSLDAMRQVSTTTPKSMPYWKDGDVRTALREDGTLYWLSRAERQKTPGRAYPSIIFFFFILWEKWLQQPTAISSPSSSSNF